MARRSHRRGDCCTPVLLVVLAFASVVLTKDTAFASQEGATNEAQRLQAEYKRVQSTHERQEVAAKLLALGPEGGRQLHLLARDEILKRLPRYTQDFQHAAATALRRRRPSVDVAELRRTILEVAESSEITKGLIEQKSDPALAQLEKLLVITPADVLNANSSLRPEREELLNLAGLAEQAVRLLTERDRVKLQIVPTRLELAAQLDATDSLSAMLATPLSPDDRQVVIANAALAEDLDPEEAQGMQRLNQIRMLVGLPAQAIDPNLVKACRIHSSDMTTSHFFAHESPVAGRETPWKRAAAAGTSANAENIAAGMSKGSEAIRAWWHSPGHHKNMLGRQKRTGLGRHEKHWTQLFG